MPDKAYTKHGSQRYSTTTLGKLVLLVKATVSENDTVTVAELSAIDYVKAVQHDTATEVAISEATNVITVTEVITSKDVYFLVAGDAA